jgi:hypothetical protein
MATVSRRRGKWVADYRDGTGRRHWETYDTRRAAEDALAQHVTAVRDGRYVPPNNKRTVREAFESWWTVGVEGDDNRGGMPLRLATRALYRLTLDLTRFSGHLMFTKEGDQDDKDTQAICAGVSAPDGTATPGGSGF